MKRIFIYSIFFSLALQGFIQIPQCYADCFSQPHQEIEVEPEPILSAEPEEGEWLPELSPFFPTMLAQPHIIGYSLGYRGYDPIFKLSTIPVSLGDQFSLYQIKTNDWGRFYFGIEACVWAIFEGRSKSLSLINADYFISIPVTYIEDKFSMRLRLSHESSHLGDEFLLEHRRMKRFNPSMEKIDFSFAYEVSSNLTTFLGYSNVIRSDEGFKIKPNMIYYGFNYFLNFWKINVGNLEANPYVATYFTNFQDNKWQLDSTVAIGYQWDKLYGHKFRVFLEGHQGFSPDGQFSKRKTKYIALKILYGY
jgi:hypothetical protein